MNYDIGDLWIFCCVVFGPIQKFEGANYKTNILLKVFKEMVLVGGGGGMAPLLCGSVPVPNHIGVRVNECLRDVKSNVVDLHFFKMSN